ncbi:MAG: hypothetical protein SGI90_05000 [Candidatus Eisenbacteria bacterium]|nr:hypothetical protein [Candidatus Eisenbacteria bacterium]
MTSPSPGPSPFRVDAKQTSSPASDGSRTSLTATVAGQTRSPAAGADRLTQLTDWLYRHRGETAVPFAIVLLVAARPTVGRLLLGLPLIILGETL